MPLLRVPYNVAYIFNACKSFIYGSLHAKGSDLRLLPNLLKPITLYMHEDELQVMVFQTTAAMFLPD